MQSFPKQKKKKRAKKKEPERPSIMHSRERLPAGNERTGLCVEI